MNAHIHSFIKNIHLRFESARACVGSRAFGAPLSRGAAAAARGVWRRCGAAAGLRLTRPLSKAAHTSLIRAQA